MRRGADEHEESHANSERWLLTYSDVITLLLALFIILYGMSAVDYKKMDAVSDAFKKSLHNNEKTPPKKTKTKKDEKNQSNGIVLPPTSGLYDAYKALTTYIAEKDIKDEITVLKTANGLEITLKDKALFHPNSAGMVEGCESLNQTAAILRQIYDQINSIIITGSTADTGDHSPTAIRNSWGLSGARALAVFYVFVDLGFSPEKFETKGVGWSKPVAPNNTEEGRARNRNVTISVS